MSLYAEQLLQRTISDSFSEREARRLLDELDANAPMREDVLRALATFKADLGPFFLEALLTGLDEGGQDPVRRAFEIAFSIPVGEIHDEINDAGADDREQEKAA